MHSTEEVDEEGLTAWAVGPADQQYPELVRGTNQRYVGTPEKVRLVSRVEQVAPVVREAVDLGKRLTVRSGGHCYEDFVFNPEVQVVLDLSRLSEVYFDPEMNAVAIESGATLLKVYQVLYRQWGVTIPAGVCYSVGMGGHVIGGGWGMLCRQYGLVVDYLYAVEVVVVDADGQVRTVVGTREPDDPNHDLWWAHTGGGGGNFGVVTRFWFRSPGATGTNPSELLPRPPATVLLSALAWSWDDLTQEQFTRLLRNYGQWHVDNLEPGSPNSVINSWLVLFHRSGGGIGLLSQVDATRPDSRSLLEDYLSKATDGVPLSQGGVAPGEGAPLQKFATPRELPWLQATTYLSTSHQVLTDPTFRAEYKSAYMRANVPEDQVAVLYKHLTREDFANPYAFVQFTPFGGQVAAVAPDATASAHRDAAYQIHWQSMWHDPAEDEANIAWSREFYEEMYASTGGVPVLDDLTDGCYINYPDADLLDPRFNRSSTPWHDLYYKDNYPRLQRIKAHWDPRNFFRHSQSIEPPA